MDDPAVLTFYPWMRRGLARLVTERADADGVPTGAVPALEAAVTVGGTEVTRSVALMGPGAVLQVSTSEIVRREPPPNAVDHEVNFFPFVELGSPDLPWQFTPAGPNADRLLPWLVLVVVPERAGVSFSTGTTGAPEVLSIGDGAATELPALREAWAWAHVQVSTPTEEGLDEAYTLRPGGFVARLLCPRVLEVGRTYHAAIVPSFAQGRQAGLGLPVTAGPSDLAWTDETDQIELPVYHRWTFRTARAPDDFEALVKRLKARTLTGTVGVHDLDVGTPGSERLPNRPGTIVGYQGALLSPTVEVPPWDPAHRQAFREAMADLLNEALAAHTEDLDEPYDALVDDPVVAPPAYGAWAASEDAIPASREDPRWLRAVNVDPDLRATAGLGAEVVRRDQEALVAQAWDQAGALADVNRALNQARLALEVGKRWKGRVAAMDAGLQVQITRGAHPRLRTPTAGLSVHGTVKQSALPAGLISGAFRRRLRAGTTVARATRGVRLDEATSLSAKVTVDFLADPVGKQGYAALTVPYGTVFASDTSVPNLEPGPRPVPSDLDRSSFGLAEGAHIVPRRATQPRPGLSVEGRRPAERPVLAAPLTAGGRARRAAEPAPDPAPHTGVGFDHRIPVAVPPTTAVSVADLAPIVLQALDPVALLAARVRSLVVAPPEAFGDEPVPASMAFSPTYTVPTSELLVRLDPQLLMPGIGTVPDDTVALASVNPTFVEAFLLGANEALSREFVWREVPVDPADTWLRRFWASGDADDIEPVSQWGPTALGTHQPEGGLDPDQVLVLVVKSDLLRRYPNTLVYAVPAAWDADDERVEDATRPRVWPSFEGSLGEGVRFLGFELPVADLTRDVVGSTDPEDRRAGWFFVFEQPPTEPRFGLDVGHPERTSAAFDTWKNVSWYRAMGADVWTESHVPIAVLNGVTRPLSVSQAPPKPVDVSDPDRLEANDLQETWGRNSAAMAAITLQRPVRMLVHADQMLRPAEEES